MPKKAKKANSSKPAKPTATKKSAKKKPAKKNASSKRGTQLSPAKPKPITEDQVFESYERCRSVRGVARELGCHRETVLARLHANEPRMRRVINEQHEEIVAGLEQAAERQIRILSAEDRAIEAAEREIEQAAAEGRVTQILDEQGMPMPVPDARQLLQSAKIKSTAIQAIHTALTHAVTARSRGVRALSGLDAGPAEGDLQGQDFQVLHRMLQQSTYQRIGVAQGLPAYDSADIARFLRDNPDASIEDFDPTPDQ